ncbi:hypothetical protein CLOSCI_02846 [[Clostridium] scindens ATCC 35704]|nr:hypothetical protein CLOSCI_02846 [[Clostridium] scindens ATCC 35704]
MLPHPFCYHSKFKYCIYYNTIILRLLYIYAKINNFYPTHTFSKTY